MRIIAGIVVLVVAFATTALNSEASCSFNRSYVAYQQAVVYVTPIPVVTFPATGYGYQYDNNLAEIRALRKEIQELRNSLRSERPEPPLLKGKEMLPAPKEVDGDETAFLGTAMKTDCAKCHSGQVSGRPVFFKGGVLTLTAEQRLQVIDAVMNERMPPPPANHPKDQKNPNAYTDEKATKLIVAAASPGGKQAKQK